MLDRLVSLVDGLPARMVRRLARTKLADTALEQANPLLLGTRQLLREDRSPAVEHLPVLLTVAALRFERAHRAGGPAQAPREFAAFVLASAQLYRLQPGAVQPGIRPVLAGELHDTDVIESWWGVIASLAGEGKPIEDPLRVVASLVLADKVLPITKDDPNLPSRLLAIARLLSRAREGADLDALAEQIGLLRRALAITGTASPQSSVVQLQLAGALFASAVPKATTEEMDEAIGLVETVLDMPALARARATQLPLLARALAERFARGRSLDVLDRAIGVYREVLAGAVPGTSQHRRYSGELGRHLHYRHQLVGDHDARVEGLRLLLDAATEPDVDQIAQETLRVLAAAAIHQYQHDGETGTLNVVIGVLERVVRPGGAEATDADLLYWLADMLRIRADYRGGPNDINRAVEYAAASVAATSAEHKDYARHVAGHGVMLLARYGHTGDLATLDAAVTTCRKAYQRCHSGHDDRGICLNHFQAALTARYSATRHLGSLDEAIEVAEQAVDEIPVHTADHVIAVINLCELLAARAERTRDGAAARRARGILEDALGRLPVEDFQRGTLMTLLGTTLLTLGRDTGEEQLRDEGIEVLEAAYEALPANHPVHGNLASRLANALYVRSGEPGANAARDRDRVIDVARNACAHLPDSHRSRTTVLCALSFGLLERARWSPANDNDLVESARLSGGLLVDQTCIGLNRFLAAMVAGRAESQLGRFQAALEAVRAGTGLLPLLAWRGNDRADQEELLAQAAPWATRFAADVAVRAGEPQQAVELFEHGRGVLMSQALEMRSEFDTLAEKAPDLAARLATARAELDPSATAAGWPNPVLRAARTGGITTGVEADRKHRYAQLWHRTLDEIRSIDGLTDFLRPAQFAELATAGTYGPVVQLYASEDSGNALIIEHAEMRVCPLPQLTVAELDLQLAAFSAATRAAVGHGVLLRQVNDQTVTEVLDWLWRAVAEPVLSELGVHSTPAAGTAWPRVWWCPAGALNFLPLHAAAPADGKDAVLDRVVSSYLPSLGALLRSRSAPRPDTTTTAPLIVAVPETVGQPPLAGAEAEARMVGQLIGGRILLGTEATPQAVREALAEHAWVHFTCHGAQDTNDPSSGRLYLHGGQLSVLEIARLRLDRAELAFLSACETALGGRSLPDEAIHLAGSLQLAGYRHVVGTLWPVLDEHAALVAERVYRWLADQPGEVAVAVHHAVRALRARAPDQPRAWAAHIHTGP